MSALPCPGCSTAMDEVSASGVTIDLCGGCHGVWLDQGELESRGAKLPSGLRLETPSTPRSCPRCVKPMVLYASGLVEIDVCRGCFGMYFDRGELELLAASAKELKFEAEGKATDAAPGPKRRPPPRATFSCPACDHEKPLEERVLGVDQIACRSCAEERGITHDPKGRRQRLKDQAMAATRTAEEGSGAGSMILGGLKVAWDVTTIVFGIIFFIADLLD